MSLTLLVTEYFVYKRHKSTKGSNIKLGSFNWNQVFVAGVMWRFTCDLRRHFVNLAFCRSAVSRNLNLRVSHGSAVVYSISRCSGYHWHGWLDPLLLWCSCRTNRSTPVIDNSALLCASHVDHVPLASPLE